MRLTKEDKEINRALNDAWARKCEAALAEHALPHDAVFLFLSSLKEPWHMTVAIHLGDVPSGGKGIAIGSLTICRGYSPKLAAAAIAGYVKPFAEARSRGLRPMPNFADAEE